MMRLAAWLLVLVASACAGPVDESFMGPPAPAEAPASLGLTPADADAAAPTVAAAPDGDARADDGEPAQPADDGLPPTRLGLDGFGDDQLVVVGRTLSTTNVGLGSAVARVLVEEHLAGPALVGERELVVLAYAGDLIRGRRDLFFLEPFRGGPRWTVTRLLDGRDPDFRAKLALTRRTAGLLNLRDPRSREAATFELVYDALVDPTPWTRRYAVAELGWLASTRADLFTDVRRRRLEALGAETAHDEVRVGVESVAIVLSRRDRALPDASSQESSRP